MPWAGYPQDGVVDFVGGSKGCATKQSAEHARPALLQYIAATLSAGLHIGPADVPMPARKAAGIGVQAGLILS